ncbi:uncharacterized protein LOC121793716 [Salvia splendens]|uniref:uncharacterized protein LOC121793716 n=1 Tax=Salvia splendens TaxID=180675 RepID=UPI0011016F70|nr:uncharacterized protein LOC121793716 [Salvia splendens]
MTPFGHTTSSPESIIEEYQAYAPRQGDDLGEFLSIYYQLWSEAHKHGVTGYGGITRLITLLPDEWRGWAVDMARDFITRRYPWYDLAGDLPQFLGQIHYYYTVYGQAPRGPYMRPGDLGRVPDMRPGDLAQIGLFPLGFQLARQRQDIGLRAPHPRERIPSPPRIILGRRTGDEFEAGPSHPPVAESIPQAILQPLPVLEDLDLGELTIAIYIDSSSEEDT